MYEHLDAGTNRAVALQPLVVFAPVAPTITQQPQDQSQPEGRQVTFTVGISGSQPLSFQWSHDNVPILDATNRSLVLPRISPDSAGAYRLHIGNVVGETNTRPAILTVLPPPADLVVSGIQAPAGIVAGRPVTVSWTVRNAGRTPAGAPWQETLYLADNPEGLHPTAVLGVTAPDSLGIGATATRSPTVIFPTGFAGRYWLAVRVDGGDQVVEDAGEANNYYVSPQPVAISSTDLVPALVSAPSGALFGDSITVGWTVTNGGTTNTASGWSDGIYLAVTPGSLAGATLLAGVPAPAVGLVAGASYNATATVKLPLGAQYPPGTYYILVAADAGNAEPESNEANNLAGRPITLGLPARPDLAVTDVGSVDTAFPGQTVPVTWAVTNRGPAVVDASWLETVRLVDAGIVGLSDPVQIQNLLASAPTLSTLRVTNRLAPGEFVRRTHFVSLPIGGASGDVRMAVTVDARDEVFEENEGNNTGYGTNRLHVPIALSLELSSATVAEDAALPVRATITRNGDRSNPLSVTLTLGDTRELSFARGTRSPASSTIIIPVGQTSVGVDLYPVQDHVVDPDQPVNVAAAAAGYESANATLTVRNVDIPTLTLAAASPSVTEGGTVALTVTRDVVTGSPLTVALGSSNPAQLSPPDLVVIPAGAASVSFAVYAVDDANPEADATYSIGASAPGFNGGVVNLTVRDNDVPSLVVSLSKRAVSEGDGPQATSMTVTRDPVGAGALTIEPFASDPALVTTPLRITIPPGQASRSFPLGVTDDSLVNGTRNVVVGAYALAAGSGARLGEADPVVLTVLDDDGPTLKVSVGQKLVPEGLNPATTVTVTRNTPPTADLAVTLVSGDPSAATLPAGLVIPKGSVSAGVPLASIADHVASGNRSVVLTASAPGYTSGLETLVVTDTDLPNLVVSSVTTPSGATPQQRVTIGYRVANHGLSATTADFLTRVYLSRDAVVGDDVLVSQFRNSGSLAVGAVFDRTEQIQLPAEVGNYWVVVETDAEQSVAEILENDNTTISAGPIAVTADYAASVQTDVDNAPAGTPVPLHGRATNASGAGVPGRPVNIHVRVRGTERVISATTDAGGLFSAVFTPLPGEAGRYEIFATHPGVASVPVQDTFELLGFQVNPASATLTLVEGSTRGGSVTLENLSDVPLTGMAVQVLAKPANLQVSAALGASQLATTLPLTYTFTASAADAYGTVQLRVSSAEGPVQDVYFGVNVEPLRPRLVAIPETLYAGMVVGTQTVVEFDVVNAGGKESGPLTLSLPAVPWMQLASANPMPSLAPGETNHVTLRLTPAPDLPLGPYTGNLAVGGIGAGLGVPFDFRAISLAVGDLAIEAVDEYTYYAEGSPRLAGATVVVRDPVTRETVATGITDANGKFLAARLREDHYEIEVTADKHATYKATHLLKAGITNNIQTFLSRQVVSYTWTVEPVTIEDRYKITIDTTFETVVPVPVVTVEPSSIDLSLITADETHVDIRVTNHGLIAANNTHLGFPSHPQWEFTPLIDRIGTLPAQSSITVPMTIRRLHPGARASVRAAGKAGVGDPGWCYSTATACWELVCGTLTNTYCGTIAIYNARPGCGGEPGPPPGGGCTDCGGTSGPSRGSYVGPSSSPTPTPCDPCLLKRLLAAAKCAIKWIPIPLPDDFKPIYECGKAAAKCAEDLSNGFGHTDVYNCGKAGLKCFASGAKTAGKILKFLKVVECACDLLTACRDIPGYTPSGVENAAAAACDFTGITSGHSRKAALASLVSTPELVPLYEATQRLRAVADYEAYLLGSYGWMRLEDGELPVAAAWMAAFEAAIDDASEGGPRVSASERIALLGMPLPAAVSGDDAANLVDRWNRSQDYWDAGILNRADVPAGQSANFIAGDVLRTLGAAAAAAFRESESAGFDSLENGVSVEIQNLKRYYETQPDSGGTCARVKLRLEQEAVLTRDAFRATLELDNNGASRLENVRVEVETRDEAGRLVPDLFGVRFEGVTTLSAVDGTGILAGNASGVAKWTLIPTVDAAPKVATRFLVGGRLSYRLGGTDVSVDMTPVPITVLPSPRLTLQYFHQRDVFSDDPFTDVIEPSIPYSLAVMVQNRGFGVARNFRISSAQPRIIENEKGLLIDFSIIATEVAGQAVSPSLTVNFGNIGPGDNAIGRWLFTSSLQGLFTDYKATWEHIDGLGNPRLSLIDDVTIHEMDHIVQAGGRFEDGKPDFLVNDVPDIHDYPDTLYLSDGTTNRVQLVQVSSVDAPVSPDHLQVELKAPMPSGWGYLRVPDPADGQYHLLRVTRSDGVVIPVGTNVWTTDRTFIGLGKRPIRENILHLLDYDGTGTYVLVYGAGAGGIVDADPPESRVADLPAASREYFQVSWSGRDLGPLGQAVSGIANYDIYVSENGGTFVPWLAKTRLVSATYVGKLGSRYAFYSVATDGNGNRQATPGTPDAQTTVSIVNQSPSITLAPSVTIDEGAVLDLAFTVADPDEGQTLTLSLLGDVPPGLLLNAAERRLTWTTGEGNGPSTHRIQVVVRDDGFPSLSATNPVVIVVREINSAPTLDDIPDAVVREGQLLSFVATAGDADLPRNRLAFSLDAGAPVGASIDPNTGEFRWTPNETQGGRTHRITVVVRDDGVPSLAAAKAFNVVVKDTQADFRVALGRTNLLAGESQSVPIHLQTGIGLDRLDFRLETGSSGLENLRLGSLAPEIQSAVIQPNAGSFLATIDFVPGALVGANDDIAALVFDTAPGRSASVVLSPVDVFGQGPDGQLFRGAGSAGKVVVVARAPVLEARPLGEPGVVLYGVAGKKYIVESSDTLDGPVWSPVQTFTLGPGERYRGLSFPLGLDSKLYRCRELP